MFTNLLKIGALASVMMSVSVNAQSWVSKTNGLAVSNATGTASNIGIGVDPDNSYKVFIKSDASYKNGLEIQNYKGETMLRQCYNGGLTIGGTTTPKKNGLYVQGVSQFNGVVHTNTLYAAKNINGSGSLDISGYAYLRGGASIKGGASFSLTDNNGFPGYISFGGTETATITVREYCGQQPSCPKNLYFDAKDYIFRNGKVGIGIETPEANLHVVGKIKCTEEIEVADLNTNAIKTETIDAQMLTAKDIQMEMHGAADYVFDENYNLKSLSEVESYVNEHKHLPGMPSAAEMDANGVSVSQMSNLLLEKVEELTLHMIKLEKENAALKAEVKELRNK